MPVRANWSSGERHIVFEYSRTTTEKREKRRERTEGRAKAANGQRQQTVQTVQNADNTGRVRLDVDQRGQPQEFPMRDKRRR
ncbi:uncharacterized protein SPSK_04711 [Sporothrix schenckii 1099-18]|uniref:Uncharacterized protein n=1 Tax=Sporothrix schenckii 1099-18 TaxID=1397361 RepID=A0A0F2M1F7_SPOSC|nr:uncharacterized protein SPSK_04711 [Sporothrix schenckii 1099-18]KJR83542.1 hypothetical protein SPSK_04711 [Sporothrix schenckii 1099-18]